MSNVKDQTSPYFMNKCIRFAVGAKTGLKSSIYNITVCKNDIYISAGILTRETKVSIHESGCGQWSYRSEVWKDRKKPNNERHIVKWNSLIPTDLKAVNVLRIRIPHTTLTQYSAPSSEDKVKWVSGLLSGTYQFDLCLTPPSQTDPARDRSDLPHEVLGTLQLNDKRWLVVFYQGTPSLSIPKEDILREIGNKDINLQGTGGMCLFGASDDGVPVMIECVLK